MFEVIFVKEQKVIEIVDLVRGVTSKKIISYMISKCNLIFKQFVTIC